MRLLVLRSKQHLTWKTLVMETADFDPKKFPGYRYYKSFPHTSQGKEQAQEYARLVEAGEGEVRRLNPGLISSIIGK